MAYQDQPGTGEVHVDNLLTNVSVLYMNPIYIAGRIFPVVIVRFRSDLIPNYGKSAWYRDEAVELSERQAPPITGYSVGNERYLCRTYGIGTFVSDDRRRNTQTPYNADRDGTMFVSDKLLMKEERLFVTKYWKTGVWGTDKIGTGDVDFTQWSDYATSTPIQDIRRWKRIIRNGMGGRDANVLVLGDLTYDVLLDHPAYLERVKYGSSSASPATVNRNLIAQLSELERVEVGLSMYTTDPEGTDEASVSYVNNWDDDALLLYVTDSPSLQTPTAGYNFVWESVLGGRRYIKRRRDPKSDRGWLIEGFENMDQHIIAADGGVFVSDAVD